MGFSFGNVDHLTRLGQAGHLKVGASILDFGSQNFYGDVDESAARLLFATFSGERFYSPHLFANGAKIDALMEALGLRYLAFDMFEGSHTRVFDFNFDTLGSEHVGKHDLVMNLGTSEHVANQFNFFKTAHDALKVGGLLYNNVPFFGGSDHALFNYHPKFFTSLIANNNYDCIHFEFSGLFNSSHWDEYTRVGNAPGGDQWEGKYTGMALLAVISRKSQDAAFLPPTDFATAGDVAVPVPLVNDIVARMGKPLEPPITARKPAQTLPPRQSTLQRWLWPELKAAPTRARDRR